MSNYRPKSLEDIKNLYDSEREAKSTIKREFSKIEQSGRKPSQTIRNISNSTPPAVTDKVKAEKSRVIEDLSPEVDRLIKNYSTEKPKRKKQSPRAVTPEGRPVHKSNVLNPAAPAIATSNGKNIEYSKPMISSSGSKAKNKKPVKSTTEKKDESKFNDLMSDYMKIMNDQDDEFEEEKRTSRFRKKNRKKHSSEPVAETNQPESENSGEAVQEPEIPEETAFEQFVESEPLYTDSKIDTEAVVEPEPIIEADASEDNFSQPYSDEEDIGSANEYSEADSEMLFSDDEQYSEQTEQTDSYNDLYNESQPEQYSEEESGESETYFQDNSDELPDDDSEYAESENQFDSYDYNDSDFSETYVTKKNSPARIFFRVICSIALVFCILATALIGSLVLVFHVNEVKPAPGGMYFFTAENNFENVGINAGDLVICRSNIESDGEQNVVYIDRENKKFTFGIKSSIVNAEDGELYYIVDDKAVERGNVIACISKTIPGVGKVISIVYSNYTPILVAMFVLSVALFLIVTVALRNKNKLLAAKPENDEVFVDDQPESEVENEEQDVYADDSSFGSEDENAQYSYDGENEYSSGDSDLPSFDESDNPFSDL